MPRKRPFYGWVIVATLFVVNFGIHATANFSFAFFMVPMARDLGASYSTLSWGQTARLLAGGISSFTLGRMVDRYGSRVLIPVTTVIASLALLSIYWVKEVWHFLALLTIVGLAGVAAPGNVVTSVPLAKWFVRKRGLAMSVATSGLAVGGVTFAPVHQALIDAFGWRWAWVASGVMTMVLVVPVSLLFMRREPEDMGLRPDGDTAPHEMAGGPVPSQRAPGIKAARWAPVPLEPSRGEAAWTPRAALRTSALWKVLVAYSLLGMAMGGFIVYRVPFWVDRGFDATAVAVAFSVDALVFGIGTMAAGVVLDRYPVRYVAAAAIALQGGGVLWMILADNGVALYGSAGLFGLGAGTGMVIQQFIWPAYYGRSSLGTIRGIIMPVQLVANGLGPPLLGFLFEAWGARATWAVFAAAAVCVAVVVTAAPPHASRAPAGAAAQRARAG